MGAKMGWQCQVCHREFDTAQTMHAHYSQAYDLSRLAQALTDLSCHARQDQEGHQKAERLEIVLTELDDETRALDKINLLEEGDEEVSLEDGSLTDSLGFYQKNNNRKNILLRKERSPRILLTAC